MEKKTSVKILGLYFAKLGTPLTLRPVLLVDDDGATLVDSGYPCTLPLLEAAMSEAGVPLSQLKRVIITHGDWDHVGLMADIIAACGSGLEVYAHAKEKPYLEGTVPYIKTTPEKVAARLATVPAETRQECAAMFAAIPNFPVSRTLEDGEILPIHGGLRIIHTPGHTPGHICLYSEQMRLLIPGDEIRVDGGKLVGPAPEHTPDMAEALRSMRKLVGLKIDRVISFHGGAYDGADIAERIRELAGV